MRRRMTGLVVSIALAAVGTMLLVAYVQSAHAKAGAAEPTTSVVVVTKLVPHGTKASSLEGKVERREIPARAKLDGAVRDIHELGDKVATADLLPGEQLVAARFESPRLVGRQGVPKGLLEVTVKLDPERAVGGVLAPGDTVAVLSSFAPFVLDASGQVVAPDAPKKTPNTTHVILHNVLVTNVQTTQAPAKTSKDSTDSSADDTKAEPAPKGALLVTLALDATSVQRVVFTAEYGTLWLSAEPADAPDGQTRIETRATVDG